VESLLLHHIQKQSKFCTMGPIVATLALGSGPKQGLAKVQAKNETQEGNFMLSGM
jgi:hypothetical protein